MQCPVCQQDQLIVEWKDVELDMCVDGHGIWFDAQELRQLFEQAGAPNILRELEDRLKALPKRGRGPVRRCPRCSGKMEQVQAPGGNVVLDRCSKGHGLWFDDGELEQIISKELPEGDSSLDMIKEFLSQFGGDKEQEKETQA